MSDSEGAAPIPHHSLGGKSLQAFEKPKYKSWRKKYRKMRVKFEGVLDENKRLFREEQKLEGLAKRLKEELE
jgi:predicted nuclease with TOPRIM domain